MSDSEGKRLFQELSLLAMEAYKRGETKTAAELLEKAHEVRARLTKQRGDRTIRAMDVDTQGQTEAVRRGAARATRKHPAQELLYKAGLTITGLAVLLGEKRSRVSAWMAQGASQRPVPASLADKMAKGIVTKSGTVLRIPRTIWARIAE